MFAHRLISDSFPSPVGELHFSIKYNFHHHKHVYISVPCRGTTFLNTIPTIPPPVWAHGRDCVGKIFLEKQIKFIRLNRQQTQYLSHARQNPNRYSLLLRNINFTLSHHIFFPLIAGTFQNMW